MLERDTLPNARRLVAAIMLLAAAALPRPVAAADIELPAGFETRLMLSNLGNPTDIEFLPSGRALVAQKNGRIYLVEGRTLLFPPVRVLPVNAEFDRGLQTILIDPEFPQHPYLYCLYTTGGESRVNRVSRFDLTDDPGQAGVSLTNELIFVDGLDSTGRIHSGGGMVMGLDGFLYVATGDGGFGSTLSQDTDRLEGKVLRFTREGIAAPGNPFIGVPGYRPEIYCTGLRNPFRMARRPGTSEIFVNDVGYVSWEEVNRVLPGVNFGWPLEEGPATAFANPVHTYPRDDESAAITGGIFYEGSQYPVEYQGNYFFADFARSTLMRLVLDGVTGEVTATEQFAYGYNTPVQLKKGPDDSLYVVLLYAGEIHRIVYVGDQNRPPSARITTTPASGIAPVTVELLADDVFDPDGDPVTFTWRINNGSPIVRTTPALLRNFVVTQTYRIDLTVDDGHGGVRAMEPYFFDANNSPPVTTITSPIAESTYASGDTITIAGGSEDAEDGSLEPSRLSWTVLFHHADHTHPFLGPISNLSSGTVVIPRIGEPSPDTSYEIRLTGTDSGGATSTESIFIRPRLVEISLETDPPGLLMTLDGRPTATPSTFIGVEGFERELGGITPQIPIGETRPFGFTRIEGHPGGRLRIVLPPSPATYRARFRPIFPY